MQHSIRARIVRLGNSRGIRVPKIWLEQLDLGDEVELAIRQDSLVIKAAHTPIEGWSAALRQWRRISTMSWWMSPGRRVGTSRHGKSSPPL